MGKEQNLLKPLIITCQSPMEGGGRGERRTTIEYVPTANPFAFTEKQTRFGPPLFVNGEM
ncbi:hypothetical protein AVEN_208583-1, partial [Araneus ventricosus]